MCIRQIVKNRVSLSSILHAADFYILGSHSKLEGIIFIVISFADIAILSRLMSSFKEDQSVGFIYFCLSELPTFDIMLVHIVLWNLSEIILRIFVERVFGLITGFLSSFRIFGAVIRNL